MNDDFKMYNGYVVAPGETILDLLEANCMTQLDLASKTGMNKKTVNEIIKGKAPITVSLALKLEYVFGVPASFWNNLESNYKIVQERQKDMEALKDEIKFLKDLPYAEMAKRGWYGIEKTRDNISRVRNLRKFFGVASLSFDTELRKRLIFRKKENDNFSLESLYCWLRYGEISSNDMHCEPFDISSLKSSVTKIRELADGSFLQNYETIRSILAESGVALVYEPSLPHTYVSGVSYKLTCDKAIIMISDKGKRDDILWFTLFHELAHLIKHSKKDIFIDQDGNSKNEIEKEADDYAKNILIDRKKYEEFVNDNSCFSDKIILEFALREKINPGIVVGRLQKDGFVGWNELNELIGRL